MNWVLECCVKLVSVLPDMIIIVFENCSKKIYKRLNDIFESFYTLLVLPLHSLSFQTTLKGVSHSSDILCNIKFSKFCTKQSQQQLKPVLLAPFRPFIQSLFSLANYSIVKRDKFSSPAKIFENFTFVLGQKMILLILVVPIFG